MQPYRQNAFGLTGSLKLRSKFYGPFKVLDKIGRRAYKLMLPEGTEIHPVFRISQLKKHHGKHAVPLPGLPSAGSDGILTEPERVIDGRIIPRKGAVVGLIKWVNLPEKDATWEDVPFITRTFKDFKP